MAVKNLYALLGLSTKASLADIQQAYVVTKALLRDIEDPARRDQRLTELDEALAILSDPIRKGVYDARLAAEPEVEAPQSQSAAAKKQPAPAAVRLSRSDRTIRLRYILFFIAGIMALFFGYAWYVIHLPTRPVEDLARLAPQLQESPEELAEKKAHADAIHQLEEAEAGLRGLDQEWVQFKRTNPTEYARDIEARKFEALREPLVAQRDEARQTLAKLRLQVYREEPDESEGGHFR